MRRASPARYAPDFRAQLDALVALRVPVASFTFGVLDAADVARLKAAGTYVIGTATHVAEGLAWQAAGADALSAQGAEAGGHRGTFIGSADDALIGTLALVPQLVDATRLPVLAAGGIMDGRGIAAALALGEHFSDGDKLCIILGDNLIEGTIAPAVERFRRQQRGARIVLKEVPDAGRFGVAELDRGRVVSIEEKPRRPKSDYAVTGLYLYDARVFDVIRTLKPSTRGELEITDVNNWYLARGELLCEVLEGWWSDAGTFGSLHRAGNLVARTGANRVDGPATRLPPGAAARGSRRPRTARKPR